MTKIGDRQILEKTDIQNRTFHISTNITKEEIITNITNFFIDSKNFSNISSSITSNITIIATNTINIAGNTCNTLNINNIRQDNKVVVDINNTINGTSGKKSSNTNHSSIAEGLRQSIIQAAAPIQFLEDIINTNLQLINNWNSITADKSNVIETAAKISNIINAICIDKIGLNPFNNPSDDTSIFNILGVNIFEIYTISQLNQYDNNFIAIPIPPPSTETSKIDPNQGFVNLVASIVNNVYIDANNIINIINNRCNIGTFTHISQFNDIRVKITNTINNCVGANKIISCENNNFQCVIADNLSNVFNYLYKELLDEYNVNIKNITPDADFQTYCKAFDSRIDILSAIELNTYYTICNSDKKLQCIMLQRFSQLGADISGIKISICGNDIPKISNNPRIWKPNPVFLDQLLAPPYLYYLIGTVLLIVILLGIVLF